MKSQFAPVYGLWVLKWSVRWEGWNSYIILILNYINRNESAAARHPYTTKRRTMNRWKKSVVPPFPTSIFDFNEILKMDQWKPYLQYLGKKTSASTTVLQATLVEAVDMSRSLLFYNNDLLVSIKNTTEIHINSTFKSRPRVPGVYQLLTSIAMKSDQVIYMVIFCVIWRI